MCLGATVSSLQLSGTNASGVPEGSGTPSVYAASRRATVRVGVTWKELDTTPEALERSPSVVLDVLSFSSALPPSAVGPVWLWFL